VGLKHAKNFIIINPYVSNVLKEYNTRLMPKKVFNIPNCLALRFFYENGKKGKNQDVSIIYCGSFVPRKGLLDLLEALKVVENRNLHFKLYLTGIIIKTNEVKAFVETVKTFVEKNIKSNVEFTGFVNPSDMASLLRKMDVLVLPSSAETAPMVIAEAMASGIPVIAYDVGGTKYMIKDGSTGFLVKVGDIKELADKIELLLTDKDLRNRMGCKAKEEARRQYHPDVVAKKTIDTYREILKSHNVELK
ncbi:glycosyltransferase family 4 protein, partial [bacterium]|nr:glycosyltransferase family 4 protein [bacterium]